MKNSEDPSVASLRVQPASLFPVNKKLNLEEVVSLVRAHIGHGDDYQKASVQIGDAHEPDLTRGNSVTSGVSLEDIFQRVQIEISNRRKSCEKKTSPSAYENQDDNEGIPSWKPFMAKLPPKREYILGDLLKFADTEFVDTAYQVIFRRPADVPGRTYFLEALRSAELSKVEILGLMRFSAEGKQRGTHIDGLLLPYKMHRWSRRRLVGPMLSFAMAVFRLPSLAKRLASIETSAAGESQAIGHLLNRINEVVDKRFTKTERALTNLDVFSDQLATLISRVETLQNVSAKVATLDAVLEARQVEFRNHRVECEKHEKEVRQRIDKHFSDTADLKLQMQAQKDERERHEREVFLKLNEQGSITGSLVQNIHSFKAEHEQFEQSMQLRVAELDRSMSDLDGELRSQSTQRDQREEGLEQLLGEQRAAMAYLGVELRALHTERENHDHDIVRRLSEHDSAIVHLGSEINASRSEQAQRGEELVAEIRTCKADFEQHGQEIARRLGEHDLASADLVKNSLDNRRGLLDVQRRLMSYLDKASTQVPGLGLTADLYKASVGDEILNAQYVAFEDKFRGERVDVKTRAAHYLANLAAANVGTASGLVLDLGCGRGEWLEVLTEQGFSCRGVDLNSVMLEDSLARGFDAVEADALEYLRGLADNSLAAITSMHLVEHLTHNVLIRLLDEALRVLQPGGVIILETPNPENITVGSCWFYLDPTHRNPIPPALLQWTVQERGFERPAIERLSENRGVPEMVSVSEDIPGAPQINQLIEWFIAPPDYAVIARKPNSGENPVQLDDNLNA